MTNRPVRYNSSGSMSLASYPKDSAKSGARNKTSRAKLSHSSGSSSSHFPPPSSGISGIGTVPSSGAAGRFQMSGGRKFAPASTISTPLVLTDEASKQREMEDFYSNYDAKEGIVTAVVLGGFFVFVSLLVLYKTKCKPMWKNRRKRLTNTPATMSVVENDSNHHPFFVCPASAGSPRHERPHSCDGLETGPDLSESNLDTEFEGGQDFGFECVPLRTVARHSNTSFGFGLSLDVSGGVARTNTLTLSEKADCGQDNNHSSVQCYEDDFDDDDEDDIYFLDEFGNYVFPVSTSTIPGSCSCPPPSAEDLSSAHSRRVSQVSQMSAAYTVKSLPGAYLYIPVIDAAVSDTSAAPLSSSSSSCLRSVKRTLSDPEIRFAYSQTPLDKMDASAAISGAPVILAVDLPASYLHDRDRGEGSITQRRPKIQRRAYSMQHPDSCLNSDAFMTSDCQLIPLEMTSVGGLSPYDVTDMNSKVHQAAIDINVIQATPNASPTSSLRSINDEVANYPYTAQSTSTTASVSSDMLLQEREHEKIRRRVSFNEEESQQHGNTGRVKVGNSQFYDISTSCVSAVTSLDSPVMGPKRSNLRKGVSAMSYLQVPGQLSGPQNQLQFAPPLSAEALAAQTSPQARKRRSTRLLKAGSFSSMTSDPDEMPESDQQQQQEAAKALAPQKHHSSCSGVGCENRWCEYLGEDVRFIDDDRSDIIVEDEDDANRHILGLPTAADQLEPPYNEMIEYIVAPLTSEESSSHYQSDDEAAEALEPPNRITVPVTIEPVPPELRVAIASQMAPVTSATSYGSRRRASLHGARTSGDGVGSAVAPTSLPQWASCDHTCSRAVAEPGAVKGGGTRMVMVRDIGVQVSGDSPNLSANRRLHRRLQSSNWSQHREEAYSSHVHRSLPSSSQPHQHQPRQRPHNMSAKSASSVMPASARSSKRDSLADKFAEEVLF